MLIKNKLFKLPNMPITSEVISQLAEQHYHAYLPANKVNALCDQFNLSKIDFGLRLASLDIFILAQIKNLKASLLGKLFMLNNLH